MINIRNLTYTYPRAQRPALAAVELQIDAGAFVLVTGPSGSGKSTLLRALGGLVPHFSGGAIAGHVEVAGRRPVAEGPGLLSRDVGYVFQNPEAQNVLDRVEDEIAFGLENAAVAPAEIAERVEAVLRLLDLLPLRRRALNTLSGGERQRVAIAAALALEPPILVLDEPTSQLDPLAASDLFATLRRLNSEQGLTIILAEHRLERMLGDVDRIVVLEGGRVAADGPAEMVLPVLPDPPPVVALGKALGWKPLPATVEAARPHVRRQTPVWPVIQQEWRLDQQEWRTSATPDAVLAVSDLHAGYAARQVLHGVTLAVAPGEVVAIMGPNGAGKSTLLRSIVGLLRPEQGTIAVSGVPTTGRDVAEICRDVAYLPQMPDDLLFAETVRDELVVTLRNHGLPADEERITQLLEKLDLQDVADDYPRDLSVGQRQRVALGAVMVTEPPLLLLDEPTRGLHGGLKAEMAELWRRCSAGGMGVLLVTHDVELVARVADRVLLLHEGTIAASGRPAAVLDPTLLAAPALEIVQRTPFIPQMARLFPGRGWLSVDAVVGELQHNVASEQDAPQEQRVQTPA